MKKYLSNEDFNAAADELCRLIEKVTPDSPENLDDGWREIVTAEVDTGTATVMISAVVSGEYIRVDDETQPGHWYDFITSHAEIYDFGANDEENNELALTASQEKDLEERMEAYEL